MHKGIKLIVKGENKEEILENVRNFLEGYQGDVWDWYVVGGRWSNTLAPKYKEFVKWANDFIKSKQDVDAIAGFMSKQLIDDNQIILQQKWIEMGLKGNNPYFNHYNLSEDGDYYDVMLLKDCIDIVKSSQQTIEEAKKEEESAKEWLNGKRDTNNYGMYGYCLSMAANLYGQKFCFDCNVFNIDNCDYSIPEDIENYSVVMVDIHN